MEKCSVNKQNMVLFSSCCPKKAMRRSHEAFKSLPGDEQKSGMTDWTESSSSGRRRTCVWTANPKLKDILYTVIEMFGTSCLHNELNVSLLSDTVKLSFNSAGLYNGMQVVVHLCYSRKLCKGQINNNDLKKYHHHPRSAQLYTWFLRTWINV